MDAGGSNERVDSLRFKEFQVFADGTMCVASLLRGSQRLCESYSLPEWLAGHKRFLACGLFFAARALGRFGHRAKWKVLGVEGILNRTITIFAV